MDQRLEETIIACNLVEEDHNITNRIQAINAVADILHCGKMDAIARHSWYINNINKTSRFAPRVSKETNGSK